MIKIVYYKCMCGHDGADQFDGEWSRKCIVCGQEQHFYKIKYNPKPVQILDRCNITGMMEEHPRYSVALGVLDEQLPDARRLHPEAEWKKFGNSWRPLIRNRADKLRMMRQAGWEEFDKK